MSQEPDTPMQKSPFCEKLRSKKYYFLDTIPMSDDDISDASNHCWCGQTKQAVGPDGDLVMPEDCTPSRSCYLSSI